MQTVEKEAVRVEFFKLCNELDPEIRQAITLRVVKLVLAKRLGLDERMLQGWKKQIKTWYDEVLSEDQASVAQAAPVNSVPVPTDFIVVEDSDEFEYDPELELPDNHEEEEEEGGEEEEEEEGGGGEEEEEEEEEEV